MLYPRSTSVYVRKSYYAKIVWRKKGLEAEKSTLRLKIQEFDLPDGDEQHGKWRNGGACIYRKKEKENVRHLEYIHCVLAVAAANLRDVLSLSTVQQVQNENCA